MTWEEISHWRLLPGRLGKVWAKSTLVTPVAVRPGMPLAAAAVDHAALALESARGLRYWWRRLTQETALAPEEPVHLWPGAVPGGPAVPVDDMKYRAVLRGAGGLLVLLAPHRPGDVIDRFLKANAGPGLHHVAFRVDDIDGSAVAVDALPGARRISPVAEDRRLDQVFYKFGDDLRIIELVRRDPGFHTASTARNIAALTAGERHDLDQNPPRRVGVPAHTPGR